MVEAAVAQQELGDAVATAHQVAAHLLARAAEIAGGLELGCRHPDRCEATCHQQAHQQQRVLAIALDPVAGPRGVFEGATTSIRIPAAWAAR